ncbi:MAG: hypothetical protein ABIY50_07400, partial [Ignavibacteria bacterium]
MQIKKRIKFPIFLKLIVLFLLFIVLVNLSLGFFIRFSFEKDPRELFGKPHLLFHQFITREIGDPPDTTRANEISKEFFLNMRFEMPGLEWSNDESVPTMEQLRNERGFEEDKPFASVNYKGKPFFINKINNGYIIFS